MVLFVNAVKMFPNNHKLEPQVQHFVRHNVMNYEKVCLAFFNIFRLFIALKLLEMFTAAVQVSRDTVLSL